MNIGAFFANSFTLDKLLIIIEQFSEEFKALAAEVLTYLFRSSIQNDSNDSLRIFKEQGGSEKLIALLMTCSTKQEHVRARLLLCFQTLTSGEDQDILGELRDLGIIPLLLNMLVSESSVPKQ